MTAGDRIDINPFSLSQLSTPNFSLHNTYKNKTFGNEKNAD